MHNQLGPYTTEPAAGSDTFSAHFQHTTDAEAMRAALLLAGVPPQAAGLTGTAQDRPVLEQSLGRELTVTGISEEQFASVYEQLNRLLPGLLAMDSHFTPEFLVTRYSNRHSSLRVAFAINPTRTTDRAMDRMEAAFRAAGLSCEQRNEMAAVPESLPLLDIGLVPGTNLLDNIERMVASHRAGGNAGHAGSGAQTPEGTAIAEYISSLMSRTPNDDPDDKKTEIRRQ